MIKKVLFISLLIALIINLPFIFNKSITPVNIEIEPKNENINLKEIKRYFVPVVGLKSKINNIEFSPDITQKINILIDDLDDIKKILNGFNQFNTFQSYEDLVKFLNTNLKEFGIINFKRLNIRLKAVSFNGLFLLDRSINYNEYKLQLSLTISENKQQGSNLEDNFKPQKLQNIGHVGSLIPARGVDYYIKTKFNGNFKLLFKQTKPIFDSIDIMSSTFEAPVLGNGRYCSACTVFVGDENFMESVEYSGIDIFSLASNHIMDGGLEGLQNTQRLLNERGLLYTGASINNDEAAKPILIENNGTRLVYLAFNDTPGIEQWATENKPGAANISDWIIDQNGRTIKYEPNEQRIKYFLDRAKVLNPDLIIILMHWGSVEYKPKPTEYTRNLAKLLIKYGANIIFGDHPHWVQEIELIEEKPVFYSVGNFVFDQTWSIETMQGIIVEVYLYDKKIINYRLHPHQLDLVQNGTIRILDKNSKEYEQVLDRIYNVSNF